MLSLISNSLATASVSSDSSSHIFWIFGCALRSAFASSCSQSQSCSVGIVLQHDGTHLGQITFCNLILLGVSLKHLLEYLGLLLDFGDFFRRLGSVICSMSCIITGHDLHQLVRFLQVFWRASPNELLQLGRLRRPFFLLQLLGRF